jgi:hypothetical protein
MTALMITKIRHRIRCFIYMGGKVFVIKVAARGAAGTGPGKTARRRRREDAAEAGGRAEPGGLLGAGAGRVA